MHLAFVPHTPGCSQGLLQISLSQNADDGQSELVKQSPGLRQPVVMGSPTKPSLQMQENPPSLSIHLKIIKLL